MRAALAVMLSLLLLLLTPLTVRAQGARAQMMNVAPNGGFLLNSLPYTTGGVTATLTVRDKAESFIATSTRLGDVEILLERTGSYTGSVLVQLRADNNGTPAGTALQTLATYTSASLPLTIVLIDYFPVVLTAPLQIGARYWIYLQKSGTVNALSLLTRFVGGAGSTLYYSGTGSGTLTSQVLGMCISANGLLCGPRNGLHQ